MRLYIFVILLLASTLAVGPCRAQAVRTWVSGLGDDANPCSRTAPCKTFAGAISKTAGGGEINCLDPGGFGVLTITKALTIYCDNVGPGAVAAGGTNGITVNLPMAGNKVVLSGLDIDGYSQTSGAAGRTGVAMIGLGVVTIRNSTIRNFSVAGISMQSPAAMPPPRLVVQNAYITNNAIGIEVAGVSGATNNATILNTLLDSNATSVSVAAGGQLALGASVLTGAGTGIAATGTGQVISFGNNVIKNGGHANATQPLE